MGPVALFALFALGFNQSFAPIMATVVATGLGWAWLGYALLSEQKSVPAPQPAMQ